MSNIKLTRGDVVKRMQQYIHRCQQNEVTGDEVEIMETAINVITSLRTLAKQESITLSNAENKIARLESKLIDGKRDAKPPALEWSDTLLEGKSVNFKEAEKVVQALGEGWRLPSRQELESLLDLTRYDPAIDTEKFPDTKKKYYWTSTPCAWSKTAVWVVYFGYGGVYSLHRGTSGCVRAVRSGQ